MKTVILLLLATSLCFARARSFGYCEEGGQQVVTSGQNSVTLVQESYPACTVTVYVTGTLTLATIYSDNMGTAKGNPFVASSVGYWFFYADNGTYDVRLSGAGIPSPFTLGAVSLFDPLGADDFGGVITGGLDLISTTGTTGAFELLNLLPYNPYNSGTTCLDAFGNKVTQPLAVSGFPTLTGIDQAIIWYGPSPSMPPSSCGTPLAVDYFNGINTNTYIFARGGFATDCQYYNCVQELAASVVNNYVGGGVQFNTFVAGTVYPTGTVTHCCGTLGTPTYLGGHIDMGHSVGPPSAGTITTVNNPFSLGEGLVAGMEYFDDALGCSQVYTGSAWVASSAPCLGGGGGSPGGSDKQIQVNAAGSFAGYANFTWDNSVDVLAVGGASGSIDVSSSTSTAAIQAPNGGITGKWLIATDSLFFIQEAAPPLSASGQSRIYMDSTTHTLLASVNGGAFAAFGGSGSSGAAGLVQVSAGSGSFIGYAPFTYTPGTGILFVGTAGSSPGLAAPLVNAYGSSGECLEINLNSAQISCSGIIQAQSLALTHGLTVDSGAYGFSGAGVLAVASCTGCGGNVVTYCAGSGTNTVTCPGVPVPVSYTDGMQITLLAGGTNTGATTLNIASLGAISVLYTGSALTAGMLTSGNLYTLYYSTTGPAFNLAPSGSGSCPAGANTQVQFNSSSSCGASSTFTFAGSVVTAPNFTTSGATGTFTSTATGGNVGYSNNGGAGAFAAIYGNGEVAAQWLSLGNQGTQLTGSSGSALISSTSTFLYSSVNGGTPLQIPQMTATAAQVPWVNSSGVLVGSSTAITYTAATGALLVGTAGSAPSFAAPFINAYGSSGECIEVNSNTAQISCAGAIGGQSAAVGLQTAAITGLGGGTGVGNALLSATTAGLYVSLNGGTPALISTGGPVGGANTDVQFNNSGAFGGSTHFTWDNINNILAVTGTAGTSGIQAITFSSSATGTTPALSVGSAINLYGNGQIGGQWVDLQSQSACPGSGSTPPQPTSGYAVLCATNSGLYLSVNNGAFTAITAGTGSSGAAGLVQVSAGSGAFIGYSNFTYTTATGVLLVGTSGSTPAVAAPLVNAYGTTGECLEINSNTAQISCAGVIQGQSATVTNGFTGQTANLNPAGSSLTQGLLVTQTASGTTGAGSYALNNISVTSDNMNDGANFGNAFEIFHQYGGSAMKGGRESLVVYSWFNGASSSANANRNYVAGAFENQVYTGDNGTSGTPAGAFFATNPITLALTGATYLLEVAGEEVDVGVQTGASTWYKAGITITQLNTDAVQGSTWDAALSISNIGGAVGWNNGILFSAANGQGPMAGTGTLLATSGSSSITGGIDFSSYIFSGYSIKMPGFSVDGSGNVLGHNLGVVGGITVDSGAFGFSATGAITAYTVQAAGVNAQISSLDRTGSGSVLMYRTGGVDYLYDSTYGNVISFDSSGTVRLLGALSAGSGYSISAQTFNATGGIISGIGGVSAGGYFVTDSGFTLRVGVTCSGTPTSSFASVGGIVTHC